MKNNLLIDVPPGMDLHGAGQVRTRSGALVEELVCRMMGWWRHPLGRNAEFCPDAKTPDGRPVEIKSVGCTTPLKGKTVVYDWRLSKESMLSHNLLYCFFCYPKSKTAHTSLAALLDHLAAVETDILLVPAPVVRHEALKCPLRTFKTTGNETARTGYTRKGYCDGYRNLSLQVLANTQMTSNPVTFAVWERKFESVIHLA